jgi:phosphatidylglycerol:prolipoprotein diacylglycerol transferase
MPFPYSIHIAGEAFTLHALFEFVGIFTAFRSYLILKKKNGDTIEPLNRLFALTAATLGAVIGSRVIGSLENVPQWLAAPSFWKYFYGNKTLVGGLVGGLVCVELVKKIIGEKRNTGDLYTFPLLLGMIIGRIGCFSAGVHEETYGVTTTLPWGMNLGDGILRHPVTLYEILFLMTLWMSLAFVKRRYLLQEGALFKLFMIAYLAFRFCLDFIKPGWRYCAGLGTIQLTCMAGLIYYYRYILNPRLLLISKRIYAS